MITVITHSADETIEFGRRIGAYLQRGDVLALQGTLAAGKTTLTKGIAQALGVEEDVTSPTFTLISEYGGRLHLYHMDAYRLDSTDDFLNLGVEDMLYGDGVCIIEWSEKVQTALPPDAVVITLESQQDNSRKITVQNWKYGALTL